METTNGTGKRPEMKFRAGAVSATIWRNETEKGSYASVQLERSYKDGDDKWKNTGSLRLNDLPKAVLVLNKTYEYLLMKGKDEREGPIAIEEIM